MEEKILDRDASKIISTGTINMPGYLPRITEEALAEIISHGIETSTGTYLLDHKSPRDKCLGHTLKNIVELNKTCSVVI